MSIGGLVDVTVILMLVIVACGILVAIMANIPPRRYSEVRRWTVVSAAIVMALLCTAVLVWQNSG